MLRPAWRRYAAEFRGVALRIAAVVSVSAGQSLLVVPMAWVVKDVFDHILPARDLSGLTRATGLLAALVLTNVVLTLITRRLVLQTTKTVVGRMREALVDALFSDPPTSSDSRRRHDLIVHDTERVDVMTNAILVLVLPALSVAAGIAVWLIALQPVLFALTAAGWCLAWISNRWTGRALRRHMADFHEQFAAWSSRVLESLAILDLVRALGADREEAARHRVSIAAVRDSSTRAAWWSNAYMLVQNAWSGLGSALLLLVGGMLVVQHRMTVGELLGFWVGSILLAAQMSVVLSAVPPIIAGDDALARVMPMVERAGTAPRTDGATGTITIGDIVLDRVAASYADREVFTDLSMTIRAQSAIAVLGANGSGKTTLVRVLLGLHAPSRGVVMSDGRPYATVDLAALRRGVGVVLQDAPLINGTIVENIVFGTSADRSAAIDAARLAGAHVFIERCDRGYDTPVGELGGRLSGGQRQLIALARALCRRPALLIFDEPTNHLDEQAVRHLLGTLATLPFRPTVVVTTHDERVAAMCSSVVRLG
jgi:ABC-type bacteriocin/lantibiotic exporter with double-glycine peptidase domain